MASRTNLVANPSYLRREVRSGASRAVFTLAFAAFART
jgi:hypothetical protein